MNDMISPAEAAIAATSNLLPTDVTNLWNAWNFVLYGIPVDKFSAWREPSKYVNAPVVSSTVHPVTTGENKDANANGTSPPTPTSTLTAGPSSGATDPEENPDVATNPASLQVLAFTFSTLEDFHGWINRVNAQDGIQYRRTIVQLREKQQCEYIHYSCYKSGKARNPASRTPPSCPCPGPGPPPASISPSSSLPSVVSRPTRKRKVKAGGSTSKLGFVCSSKIIARRHFTDGSVAWKKLDGPLGRDGLSPLESERVPVSAGQVSVLYTHTHGHRLERGVNSYAPISDHTKRVIRIWRALGMALDDIYDTLVQARLTYDAEVSAGCVDHNPAGTLMHPGSRDRVITRRDVRNILVAAGLYKRMDRCPPVCGSGSSPLSASEVQVGDYLVTELERTYGQDNGPIPPPIWGPPHTMEDAAVARHCVSMYRHLKAATSHLERMGTPLHQALTFATYTHQMDAGRMSILNTTCKKLLFPMFAPLGATMHFNDELFPVTQGNQGNQGNGNGSILPSPTPSPLLSSSSASSLQLPATSSLHLTPHPHLLHPGHPPSLQSQAALYPGELPPSSTASLALQALLPPLTPVARTSPPPMRQHRMKKTVPPASNAQSLTELDSPQQFV